MSLRHLLFVFAVAIFAAAGGVARAMDRDPPRIAHYSSEYAQVGFVLDRSGELAKLRFDGSEEIFILRWQPAAGGDRLLVRDDGEVVLRLSSLGGITLFTSENRRGIPMEPDKPAAPLEPPPPSLSAVREITGRIMSQLRAETGHEIVFEANWTEVSADPGGRGILFDAIRNAGTALFETAQTPRGRTAMTIRLKRVRFAQARLPSAALQGDILIVEFSVDQGLAGRPSSYAIRRQLAQIKR